MRNRSDKCLFACALNISGGNVNYLTAVRMCNDNDIIFADDVVYMEKNGDLELDPDEYVLRESGSIWRGSWKRFFGFPWNFGQVSNNMSNTSSLFQIWCKKNVAGMEGGDSFAINATFTERLVNKFVTQLV